MRENALRSERKIGFECGKGYRFGDGDDSLPYGMSGIPFAADIYESLPKINRIGMKAGDLL